ncbi:MAG: copper homeostasis protein CutC [Candidatus Nanopelagicales bacterium]
MVRELEICCFSVADALVAQENGADRIELCAGRPEGGTTPSLGVLRQAREAITIPVFVMVRPRGGDFQYDDYEFKAMQSDVITIAELGFDGIVVGVLDAQRQVDTDRCARLVDAAKATNPHIQLTFHRAFDDVADPLEAYASIGGLQFTRILTSGQQESALLGVELLDVLINHLGNQPIVMPGGGVRPGNVGEFLDLGATNVHSSATPDSSHGVDGSTVAALARAVHRK